MELISLKADFAAKELFAHEKVRKQFLSDTLGIPLEDIRSVRLVNRFYADGTEDRSRASWMWRWN